MDKPKFNEDQFKKVLTGILHAKPIKLKKENQPKRKSKGRANPAKKK